MFIIWPERKEPLASVESSCSSFHPVLLSCTHAQITVEKMSFHMTGKLPYFLSESSVLSNDDWVSQSMKGI